MTETEERLAILRALLQVTGDFLHHLGVEYWLDYGTLLGAYRRQTIIRWDLDVDLSVREEDAEVVRGAGDLLPEGYSLHDTSYRHGGPKFWIGHRGCSADIYTYRKVKGGRRVNLAGVFCSAMDAKTIGEEMLFPLADCALEGRSWPCPAQTRAYLIERYGYLGEDAVRDPKTGAYHRLPCIEIEDLLFYPGLDSEGGDLRCVGRQTFSELRACHLGDDRSVAFNSQGWLKKELQPPGRWRRWTSSPTRGLYVSREQVFCDDGETSASAQSVDWTTRELLRSFPDVWSSRDRRVVRRMLAAVDAVLTKARIPYALAYGTLLGCVRHGGLIPWDDDVDVCIDERSLLRFMSLRRELEQRGYGLADWWGGQKIYALDGKPIPIGGTRLRGYRWPFVDVFPFRVRGDEVHIPIGRQTYYTCSREEMFPFKRAPFEDLRLLVPSCPDVHLDTCYPGWRIECVSPDWCHKQERRPPEPRRTVPKSALDPYYTFLV